MRLNKLSMSNIGPYVGLVSLDFARLGDIFLICGKTGSGKTTIFDALAYALYGGAAGTREMTSHFAGTTDDVFVELEFMVGKAGWKVLRKPARQSLKKKGSGMTERPSEVVLWHREGAAWIPAGDKTSDVDSTLERVIGLSADEFTKIVLLPQGEFQRFLEMKTGDRTEILEKLFPVTIHSAVSELAKLKARDTEVQARDLDSRIKSIEMEVGETPEIELETAKASLDAARAAEKAALATLDSAKSAEQAASIGARAFAELDAAEAERDALLATASEAASARARLARAEAAAGIGGFIEAARRARAELLEAGRIRDEATRSVAVSDAVAEEVKQHETRLATLNTGLVAMDHESGLLSAKLAAWERLSLASARLSGARERLSEARSVREASSQELEAKTEALALLEASAGDTVALEAGRAAAVAGLAVAADAARLAQEATRFASEVAIMREKLAARGQEAEAAELRRVAVVVELGTAERTVEELRDETAARRLAARLAPGEPCPVCGSTDHPAHVQALENEGTADAGLSGAFTKAEQVLANAREQAMEAEKQASSAKTRLEESESALAERTSQQNRFEGALDPVVADQRLREATEQLRAVDEAIAAESGRVAQVALLRNEIDTLRKAHDLAVLHEAAESSTVSAADSAVHELGSGAGGSDPTPLIAALEQKRNSATQEKAGLESSITAWRTDRSAAMTRSIEADARRNRAATLVDATHADAENALREAGFDTEELWSAAVLLPAALAETRAAVHSRASAEAGNTARLAAAIRAVNGAERPDLPAIAAALSKAALDFDDARVSVDEAARLERELSSALATLTSLRAERAALRNKGERLVSMARFLNGDTEGRHLSFKNFALGSYFSMVVEHASIRLREMSDGRYDMRVAEGKAAGRGRVGLDLEVLDAFTGFARPASSLSGGEKFLASISLALGLSDVIVSRSGGVALDSIFIDEGFGSLDDETLDRAMVALDRIRGERVIGIISHVAELRTRVPVLVEVMKSNTGSKIHVTS